MEEQQDGAILAWEFAAYPQYNRGKLWYVLAIGGGFALLLYAVISGNFLFALFIVMFALVTYLGSVTRPPIVQVAVMPDGIAVGNSFYRYRELKRFWFVYEPPEVRSLYLTTSSLLSPQVTVDLADQDPNEVRAVIGRFVHEELAEQEEPWSDIIARVLKI